MAAPHEKRYFYFSLLLHSVLLSILIFGYCFSTPLPVFENTNQNNIISAVVLGDIASSKIVTPQNVPPPVAEEKPKSSLMVKSQSIPEEIKKDVIALAIQKKNIALAKKKQQEDLLAKELLADLKKHTENQQKVKQKLLKAQFEKTLQEQAEKSLREQLLNEEVRLHAVQSKQARGEVNKYKALILQVISQNWLIPSHVNKKLSCELLIRLAPGGVVLTVRLKKSSGDPALDSSARAAVLKSSPLPVPADTKAFEAFREFVLKVKPENVLANG